MSYSSLMQAVVVVAVAIIMFCLGIGLHVRQFKAALKSPRVVLTAMICQVILPPLLALALAHVLALDAVTATGLVLMAACPGNAPVSLLARAGGGNVALAVSTTALTNFTAPLTIPAALALVSAWHPAHRLAPSDLWLVASRVFLLTSLPVLMGMVTRAVWPAIAISLLPRAIRIASIAFAVGLAAVIAQVWSEIPAAMARAGLLTISLNLLIVAAAFAIVRLVRLDSSASTSIVLCSSTRSFTIAAFVALTLLGNRPLLLPAIAYGLLMWLAASAIAAVMRHGTSMQRQPALQASEPT